MASWQEKARIILSGIQLVQDMPMSQLTTFKIGGPLDLLTEPRNVDELGRIIQFCRVENLPWLVIGLGSNLLVRDKGIRGVGIKLGGEFSRWEVAGSRIKVGAGVVLADLAKETASIGLTGLEFACGIPGSTGGAIFMNAGAYDGEMSKIVASVEAYNSRTGQQISYQNTELNFGYRHSRFQDEPGNIITGLTLQLQQSDAQSTTGKVTELTCRRESSQPLDMPSAGSVFRRPEGYFVGPIITEAGLKGFSIGGARVSDKHSGFIVNQGNATAADVLALIAHIQRAVKERAGVDLTPEYRIVGED
jgi:UDP-N-acetylmuramate dehydrogenase